MEFFDSLINEVNSVIAPLKSVQAPFNPQNSWADAGQSQFILQRDTLFELDGVGFNLITSKKISDGTVVMGKDLQEIKKDCKFARITFIELNQEEDQQKMYNLIRKVEYTKYHFFPDGYMVRSTSRSHKENIRVSKTAIKAGIDFQRVGSLLIKKYKENPAVKGVKVVFVTDASADFKALEALARKNNDITEALNHVMNSVNFDCDTCSLKAVCDEVEGMRELHFKTSMGK